MSVERFLEKVDTTGECWEWLGRKDHEGYGIHAVDGKTVRAARFAHELLIGPIPPSFQVDHLCRNHACVNPAHLEAVTQRENILRGTGPTAINAAKTHCIHGHEFTPENTRIYVRPGSNERVCRKCHAIKTLADYHARKAAA